ncbi:STAS domain-containing protein [Tropicimonas sp. IMCC6043]|uniref:STAS domain-containing protein n=1 Tax=Tropicimonas sp. IMCC6043 TaxID=2510645 RepID=UPI00101E049F|nr:STAS domain-containing protein [Tropicimonas sp. IMCC6043]RYH09071.1 anti-sigma factor antagonist [Tropicimonas sp. IMCC6043]
MEFETTRQGGILRINVLAERIDAACAIEFKDRIRELCGEEPPRVILDMQRVDFLDSSGLGAVVAVMKILGKDRSLELAGLSTKVSKVFRLTRMDSVFKIHPSAAAVMKSNASAA